MTVEWSPCFHPCLFVNVCRTQMKRQQWSAVHHVAPLFFLFRTWWSLENNTRKTRGLDKHFRPVILLYSKVMTLWGGYVCTATLQLVCLPPLLEQSLMVPHINIQCVCDWRRKKNVPAFIQTRQLRESNCSDNRVGRWQGWGMAMEVILDIY